jgi:hypothetical protein
VSDHSTHLFPNTLLHGKVPGHLNDVLTEAAPLLHDTCHQQLRTMNLAVI